MPEFLAETYAPRGAAVFDAGLLAVPGLEALREIHAGGSPQPRAGG